MEGFLSEKTKEFYQELDAIWEEIGYSEEDRKMKIDEINQKIMKERDDYVNKTLLKCKELNDQIDEIKANHIKMLNALGASEVEIRKVEESGKEGSIRDRNKEVQENFDKICEVYEKRRSEVEELQNKINSISFKLGIEGEEEKKENNDLTEKRLNELNKIYSKLEKKFNEKLVEFQNVKDDVEEEAGELEEELPSDINEIFVNQLLTNEAMQKLLGYLQCLKNLKESRKKNIEEMQEKIKKLSELLKLDKEITSFFNSHNNLSRNCINDYLNEINRLMKLRNESLSSIIKDKEKELREACSKLSYNEEKIQEILNECQNTQNKEENNEEEEKKLKHKSQVSFNIPEENSEKLLKIIENYGNKIADLNKIYETSKPVIELIEERNKNLNMLKSLDSITDDAKRERISNSYKNILKGNEKKLKIELMCYQRINKEDFMWEGEPLIQQFQSIQVNKEEINLALKKYRNTKRRKTISADSNSIKLTPKTNHKPEQATPPQKDKQIRKNAQLAPKRKTMRDPRMHHLSLN